MKTIATGGALEFDDGDDGHRSSTAAAWTDEQAAYFLFLRNACARLEVIAVETGIEPHLVDDFVRDGLVTIHHARHTRARGRRGEAWIEAIARNLARKRRYRATMRARRQSIFWSLCSFSRDHRHREGYAEAHRLTSAMAVSEDDVTAVQGAASGA